MSEFECSQGHLMSPRDSRCNICGGRVARMDGKSNRQLRMEEEYEEREERSRSEEFREDDDPNY